MKKTFYWLVLCTIFTTLTNANQQKFTPETLTEKQRKTFEYLFQKAISKVKNNDGTYLTPEQREKVTKYIHTVLNNRSSHFTDTIISDIKDCIEIVQECVDMIKQLVGNPVNNGFDCLDCDQYENIFQFLFCACQNLAISESKLCELETKIEALDDCSCTVVRQVDFSFNEYTISLPGCYCLGEDVTGRIVIDSNNVTIDLNNHSIQSASDTFRNISIFNNRQNITITNGTITRNQSHSGAAILLIGFSFSNITFKDVRFNLRENTTSAIEFVALEPVTTVNNVSINNCIFAGNNTVGDKCSETNGIGFILPSGLPPANLELFNFNVTNCEFVALSNGILLEASNLNSYNIDSFTVTDCLFHDLCHNGINFEDTTVFLSKKDNRCAPTDDRILTNFTVKNTEFKNIVTAEFPDQINYGNGIAFNSATGNVCIDTVTIENCIFSNITSDNPSPQINKGNGIGIFARSNTDNVKNFCINDCTFSNIIGSSNTFLESNAGNGIAFYLHDSGENITVNNCTFARIFGQRATNGNVGNGIGLFSESGSFNNITTSNCTFLELDGSLLDTNPSNDTGYGNVGNGIGIYTQQEINDVTTVNCSFLDICGDTALQGNVGNGIGLYSANDQRIVLFSDCNFSKIKGNVLTDGNAGNGIGIFVSDSSITILMYENNFFADISGQADAQNTGNGIAVNVDNAIQDFFASKCVFNNITGPTREPGRVVGTGIGFNGRNIFNFTANTSEFQNISTAGIDIQSEENLEPVSISNSIFTHMQERGISIDRGNSANTGKSCVQISNCHLLGAENATDPQLGVYIKNFANAVIQNSSASCFANTIIPSDTLGTDGPCSLIPSGFLTENCNNVYVRNNIAKANYNGFTVCTDIGNETQGIVRDCTSEGNINSGFELGGDGTHSVEFYRNIACFNGTNFSNNITSAAVISPPAIPKAFQNIDCGE